MRKVTIVKLMRKVTMVSVQLGVILVACVCYVTANTTPPQGCTQDGVHYHHGQTFQPTPCKSCQCTSSGRVVCAIGDCFYVPCVDSVPDPTRCCPRCPNGHNCQHSDGTIIKQGEVYKPDPYTTCECPQNMFMMRGGPAICARHTIPTTTVAPLTPAKPVVS